MFFRQHPAANATLSYLFGCAGLQPGYMAGHYQRVPMEVAGWDARRVLMTEWVYALAKNTLMLNRRADGN